MPPEPPPRPLVNLPVGGAAPPPPATAPARHETVLPDEPAAAAEELSQALAVQGEEAARRTALGRVAGRHPAMLEAWARLSELALRSGDPVAAYAFARVSYHRGLDRLRREGWGGTGMVRWARPSNRGFLRGLHALMAAAAALDETEEAGRCRRFLLDLDPDDAVGAAAYPAVPGPAWTPPQLPD